MKIRIHTNDLNAVLKDTTRAIESKCVVPWMSGVLLEAKDGILNATCTNGTQTIVRREACEVREEGTVLVDGKLLLNVASKLPSGSCEIDANSGKKAVIKADGSKTNMALMDETAFVKPGNFEQSFSFRTDATSLFTAFKTVLYAVPTQDNRATLTGVNVQGKGGMLHLCGMDGYRMAVSKVEADTGDEEFNIIIPRKTVVDMLGICSDTESEITLRSDGKHIAVLSGKTELMSQLIAGAYAAYKQIIQNTKHTCRVLFKTQALKDAATRAMVMCEGKNNLLKLNVLDDGMIISGMGDAGDVTEKMECHVSGDGLEIGFNGRLLLDAVGAIGEENAVFQFSSSVGPAFLTSESRSTWMHVVLPVRTN